MQTPPRTHRSQAPGANCLGHPLWYQRVYAWLRSGDNALYDAAVAAGERDLFGALSGMGLGPWCDVNPPFLIARAAGSASRHIRMFTGGAYPRGRCKRRRGDFGPGPLSVVSLPQPLREIRRVLRAEGSLGFLEHIAAPYRSGMRAVQRAVRPLRRRLTGRCLPDRETWRAIEEAGFEA